MAINVTLPLIESTFQTYITNERRSLFEQKHKFYDMIMQMCSKETLTQAGLEQINTSDRVALQLKGGRAGMSFPAGSGVSGSRYKVGTVIQAFTLLTDGSTFKDINSGNQKAALSLTETLDVLTQEYYKNQEMFLAGNGSGALAVLDAGSTTTVLRVRNVPSAINGSSFGARKLKAQFSSGDAVEYDLIDPAAGTPLVATGLKISSITPGTAYDSVTLTAALAAAPATGLLLVYKDSYRNAPYGLDFLVDGKKTGDWQGLLVTGQEQHQSAVADGGGLIFDELALDNLMQAYALQHGEGVNGTFKVFTSPNMVRRWAMRGEARIVYQGTPQANNIGIKGAGYQDSTIQEWVWCETGSFYAGDWSDIMCGSQWKLAPVTYGDSRMWKQDPTGAGGTGTDKLFCQYNESYNFLNKMPRGFFRGRNYDANGVTQGKLSTYFV